MIMYGNQFIKFNRTDTLPNSYLRNNSASPFKCMHLCIWCTTNLLRGWFILFYVLFCI